MEYIQNTMVPSQMPEPRQGLDSQEDSQPFLDTQSFAQRCRLAEVISLP